jgi:hypothetical protein
VSTVDFAEAKWRKSSRSGSGSGNACVEVAFADWRKSSQSGDGSNGDCVEVAFAEVIVGVRDSKHPSGSHLTFSDAAWRRALRSWC